MRFAVEDILVALQQKEKETPWAVSCHERAIISRLKGVIESVGFADRLQHVTRDPDTDTIWRFDNESYCVNALFKDMTVQTAGQAFHSPDVAKLAAEDMAKGLTYCPFNRRVITYFLICSRRERELFRIANKKEKNESQESQEG
jgi:hypothetical protein